MTPLTARGYPLGSWALERVAHWRWRHTGLAVLIGALTLFAMGWPLNPSPGEPKLFEPLAYNVIQFGLPMVFLVGLADRAVDAGARPWVAYSLAVLTVTLVGVWPIARMLWPLLGKEPYWGLANDFWLAFNSQLWHALGVAVYASWRRERQVRERAITAEREQAERARQLATARLLALQAQVEPKLLFDALTELLRLQVPATAARADRLLEDLITLLRLLLTRADVQARALGREQALVQALGRVLGEPALLPPRLLWRIDEEAFTAQVAPLWLPRLLRQTAAAAAPDAAWIVSAQRQGARVRLLILAEAGAISAHRAVAETMAPAAIEASLREVHGPEVLVQRIGDVALTAETCILWRIEWPFRAQTFGSDDDPRADR